MRYSEFRRRHYNNRNLCCSKGKLDTPELPRSMESGRLGKSDTPEL